jgi:hypothetical protein
MRFGSSIDYGFHEVRADWPVGDEPELELRCERVGGEGLKKLSIPLGEALDRFLQTAWGPRLGRVSGRMFELHAEIDCLVGLSACPWLGRGNELEVTVFQP